MVRFYFTFLAGEVPIGAFRLRFGAKKVIGVTVLTLTLSMLSAQNAQAEKALRGLGHPYFIENKGRWPADVLYLCRLGGLDF